MPSPALHFLRAPLVPVALFITGGIVLDRYLSPPFLFSFAFSLAAWLAWITLHAGPDRRLQVVYLWVGCFGLGALYHHWYLHSVPLTDIRHLASQEMK